MARFAAAGSSGAPPIKRRGIIWVVDSKTGHLAVAHRGNALMQILQEPTRIFYQVAEVRAALPPTFPPTALILGYCNVSDAVKLVTETPLGELPILVTDNYRRWPFGELPTTVHHWDQLHVHSALQRFNDGVLGRR